MSQAKSNKVLMKMLDRLLAGLMNGAGMNCRPHASRQRIDLTQIARLKDISPEEVLRELLGLQREAKVVARVKPPKKADKPEPRISASPTDESPQPITTDESAPVKDKPWEEQTALLNKLRVVADDARTYENDTGVHVLNVGFPLLSLPPGSFSAGPRNSTKRILAPIAFIPVTLTLKRGAAPSVELACRGEGVDRVMPNTALLAWLEQQTGKPQAELFADDEGDDPWREIRALVGHVAAAVNLQPPPEFILTEAGKAPVPRNAQDEARPSSPADEDATTETITPASGEAAQEGAQAPAPQNTIHPFPSALVLEPAPRPDSDHDAPAILCSAVLGLFPMANQGLLRDTQAMLAQSEDPAAPPLDGPVQSFLTANIDFDQPAPPAVENPEPRAAVTKIFVSERLAASADPCQARAVALARNSRGLVVHGPPGTGKSQTITNIIADHLSRGQRVLLVCEKRTALDVVANRLEHMGLGRLCGIVHDPQRDQRDLYKNIRQQLDDLPELAAHPRAENELLKVDEELQRLHGELTEYHHALMTAPQAGEPSFHELMGNWLGTSAPAEIRISPTSAQAITPAQLDAHEPALLDLLRRAERIDFARNPWAKCAGITLPDFLSRPMDSIRVAVDRCSAAAAAADKTIDPAIPPFSIKSPLPQQGQARAEIAERLQALLRQISPAALSRWCGQDLPALRAASQKLTALEPSAQLLSAGPLDLELRAIADPLPTMQQIAQQTRSLENYLEVAGKWYAMFSFGVKSEAAKALKQYGLPLTASEAERLKKFLTALRARIMIQQIRAELAGAAAAPAISSVPLPPDDVLDRFMSQHAELLAILIRLHDDAALEGLAPLAARSLPDPSAAALFVEGLSRSPARAEAISRFEDALAESHLFDAGWLAAFSAKLRQNAAAGEVAAALSNQLPTLEGVLRVRQARAALPPEVIAAVDEILTQSHDPVLAITALRKLVLAGEITRRLRDDPQLQAMDAHRIESSFDRYRELEAKKKQLVSRAVQHRWAQKQKDRLLAGTGSRLNSLGADLRRRLTIRGERAMRLRQVISIGEKIEGGDPLFDLSPVWMASPETVAQVFPRKPLFDVIVFDEASQCRLEEALPVLTRGQRVVIAGDPRQLPPTRFFESAFTQSEEQEPETEQELFESQQAEVEDLLGAALNLAIQQCYLDVHYRSRNADLIGFSNENFYNNRLQAIPGHPRNRARYSPLNLYRVNGTYNNRKNETEAARVAQIVKDLLKRAEPPSIGIACFNLQQRDLIVEQLDDAALADPDFARRLAAARTRKGAGSFDGLFVKNLENVQGDERDHIIISTTYGPDAKGRFYRRFGPLGRAGGGRRLNVLVTRARHEVHLVTSIPPEATRNLPPIPQGQSPTGAYLLFAYLNYAERLNAEYQQAAGDPITADGVGSNSAPNVVIENPSRSPSAFARHLAGYLSRQHQTGSTVNWGNEGFCVDVAMHHPQRPDDVTIGLLCDSCRYNAADDPVEWDIFRTGILASQGWKLHRIWTPHFFRDPEGNIAAVLASARRLLESEAPGNAEQR